MIKVIADERLRLVEHLRALPPDAWHRPSLCDGWSTHHVLAHLVTPFLVSMPVMGLSILRGRGLSGAMDRQARRLAARPVAELLDVLERNAATPFRPPGMPFEAPLTDVVAHGADIRWALGAERADDGDPARLRPVLDFLVGSAARGGLVPAGRLRGVRLVTDDLPWSSGEGVEVHGPALALVMGVLGRPEAQPLLQGAAGQLSSARRPPA